MATEISNCDDIIDSRDVIERIEELESMVENDNDSVTEDEIEELKLLKQLALECEGWRDWADGITLINEDHFTDYAKDLATDLGLIKDDCAWPYTCIDWEQAASDLQHDYSCIDFGGNTFYCLS